MNTYRIIEGDCVEAMRAAASRGSLVDSVVCDPPYHLASIVKRFGKPGSAPAKSGQTGVYARSSTGFMGKQWDGGDVAFDPETWRAVYDLLRPGGHLVAFSGTRTYHRMACAIEDAGFEIRDQLAWVYGTGFPKSHNVSKGIDKIHGADREVIGDNPNHRPISGINYEGIYAGGNTGARKITGAATNSAKKWEGWGTALKPSWEPIVLARKPLEGTVAGNILAHGTGAINIDGCRVGTKGGTRKAGPPSYKPGISLQGSLDGSLNGGGGCEDIGKGRWPTNIVHDGSDEVMESFPGDGSVSRFFYCAKAPKVERDGSKHPTVKPVDLMRWLVRMVTRPGGTVLDPFAGTGTTGEAALSEGMRAILIEAEPDYIIDIRRRMSRAAGESQPVRTRTRARKQHRTQQPGELGGSPAGPQDA